jgi:hypothetical protein
MLTKNAVADGSAKSVPHASAPISRQEWDAFVDKSAQGSVYCKSWWLDAVCPDAYELIAVRRDGLIRAGMALPVARARGHLSVRMPPLTQTLGPLLWLPCGQKYGSQLSYEMKILRELVAAIPASDEFFVNCSRQFTNWLPFHWAGYSQTTRYSYQIDDLTDLPAVLEGMSDKTRNIIRKAEKAGIRIEECDDLQVALPLFEMTYSRQGMSFPYDPALIERIDRGASAHAGRKIFLARDETGRLHAAIYIVHTPRCAYYVMQGTDPALRASGAPLLAHWHAIQFAAGVSQSYDFVGSMMENVERVFRSFGAIQKPYSSIYMAPRRAGLREWAQSGRNLLLGRFALAAAWLTCKWTEAVSSSVLSAPTMALV